MVCFFIFPGRPLLLLFLSVGGALRSACSTSLSVLQLVSGRGGTDSERKESNVLVGSYTLTGRARCDLGADPGTESEEEAVEVEDLILDRLPGLPSDCRRTLTEAGLAGSVPARFGKRSSDEAAPLLPCHFSAMTQQ